MQDVALASACLDMLRQIRVALDLPAQAKHENIDVTIDEAVAFRTEAIEDMGSTDRLVRRFRQNFQKGEFGRRQRPAAVCKADGAPP